MKIIETAEFDAGSLVREFPPRFFHPNKEIVWEIANSTGAAFEGRIRYTRWEAAGLPEMMDAGGHFLIQKGLFQYSSSDEPKKMEWHMNFADPELFGFYGSGLMVQDELQVAEHPALGSLREALISKGYGPRTVDERGNSTPVAVSGVQRLCLVDILPNADEGREAGLYGNAFAAARRDLVQKATLGLNPAPVSNILALAAPYGRSGIYSIEEIRYILSTAYSGFAAAHSASEDAMGAGVQTVIHTGFWGCGAFGGNRKLMTLLQAMAGDLAGTAVVFWAFDERGVEVAEEAYGEYQRLRDETSEVTQALEKLRISGIRWGVSDGN